jgi:Arc/MetJ-type ribon-helix-helix transcriptional regulator
MARAVLAKRDFATRLSPQTLAQLDTLVGQGAFRNRTEAIETAVDRLFLAQQRDPVRLRRAFDQAHGTIQGGSDRESWRRAEMDRLEWETDRASGQR